MKTITEVANASDKAIVAIRELQMELPTELAEKIGDAIWIIRNTQIKHADQVIAENIRADEEREAPYRAEARFA